MKLPWIAFLVSFFYHVITKAQIPCAKEGIEKDTCILCNYTHYKVDRPYFPLTSFPTSKCLPKLLSTYNKTAFISDESICNQLCDGTVLNPYKTIQEALSKENEIARRHLQSFLEFFLFSSSREFFVLDGIFDLDNIFRRMDAEIRMSPGLCSEFPNFNNCFQNFDKAIVYLKSKTFKIFVGKKFFISNIILDGSDLVLASTHECLGQNQVCCNNFDSVNYYLLPKECRDPLAREATIPQKKYGLFHLEVAKEDGGSDYSEFIILGSHIRNFYVLEGFLFGFLVFSKNFRIFALECYFLNNFFPGGMFSLVESAEDFFTLNTIQNLSAQESYITISKSKIENYNAFQVILAKSHSIFQFNNFRGRVTIDLCEFVGNNKGSLYFSSLISFSVPEAEGEGSLEINDSRFLRNEASAVAEISGYRGQFSFKLIVIIRGIKMEENLVETGFIIRQITGANISLSLLGVLPGTQLIKISYSSLNLLNSSISNAFPRIGSVHCLLYSESNYATSIQDQFIRKTELKFTAIDEIYIQNLTVKSSKHLSLIRNLHSIKGLTVFDSLFQNMTLSGNANLPFINIAVESLFLMVGCHFQNIRLTSVGILFLSPVYNATIKQSSFVDVSLSDATLWYLLSQTEYNTAHVAYFDENLIDNISMVYQDTSKLESKYKRAFINCVQFETGKGFHLIAVKLVIRNVNFQYYKENSFVFELYIGHLNISQFSIENITNSTILYYFITTINGSIILKDIWANLTTYPVARFYKNSIELYGFAFVANLVIVGALFKENSILSFYNPSKFTILDSIIIGTTVNGVHLTVSVPSPTQLLVMGCVLFGSEEHYHSNFAMGFSISSGFAKEFNISQWDSNFNTSNMTFGLINCAFIILSNSAIRLLKGSQLYIKNVTVHSVYGTNGGVLFLETGSAAFIENITAHNIKGLETGAGFYLLSSKLIIKNCKIIQIQSFQDAGGIFLKDSYLILDQIESEITEGFRGGFLVSESSYVYIINSILRASVAKTKGGFIFSKLGNLNIFNTTLSRGEAKDRGSCIFAEETDTSMKSVSIVDSVTEYMATLCFLGLRAILWSTVISNNSGPFSTCLLSYESSIFLRDLLILGNKALDGNLIEFYSTYAQVKIDIGNIVCKGNKILGSGGVFYIQNIAFTVNYGQFESNEGFERLVHSYSCLINLFNLNATVSSPRVLDSEKSQKAYLFYGKKSSMNLQDAILLCNNTLGALSCTICQITIVKVEVQQTFSLNGPGVELTNTQATISECRFFNNKGLQMGLMLILDCDRVVIVGCSFFENKNANNNYACNINSLQTDRKMLRPVIEIKDCIFQNVSGVNIKSKFNVILMENCSMTGSPDILSQCLSCIDCLEVSILNCKISSFQYGGAFYFYVGNNKLSISNYSIRNSVISNCSTISSGGAVAAFGNAQLEIYDSSFFHDKSDKNGGAINMICGKFASENCTLNIRRSKFSFCHAKSFGGAIFLSSSIDVKDDTVIMENNTAEIGLNAASPPSDFLFYLHSEEEEAVQIVEQFPLKIGKPYYFDIVLLDAFKNIINEIEEIYFNLRVVHESKELNIGLENNVGMILKGNGSLKGFTISSTKTHSNIVIAVTLNSEKIGTITNNFTFNLLPCEKGDIFQANRCLPCPEGYFSLEKEPMAHGVNLCIDCPKHAICYGKSDMIPKPGYWRAPDESIIVQCKSTTICPQAQTKFTFEGQCAMGYRGHLCQQCLEGNLFLMGKCEGCFESKSFWLIIIFGYLIFFLFVMITKNDIMKSNTSTETSEMSMMVKFLVNHISYFTMISIFDLDWREEIVNFLNFFEIYTTTAPVGIFSYECFFQNGVDTNSLYFLILICFSPVLLFSLYYLTEKSVVFAITNFRKFTNKCYFIVNWQKQSRRKIEVLVTFAVVLLNIYTVVMVKLVDVIRCVELKSSASFMKINLEIQCWSPEHHNYLIWASIFIVFWGLGYPAFLYFISKKSFIPDTHSVKQKLTDVQIKSSIKLKGWRQMKQSIEGNTPENRFVSNAVEDISLRLPVSAASNVSLLNQLAKNKSIQNLLINGYSKPFYYWESVVYLRRLFVIFISLLREFLDLRALSCTITIIFFAFLFINEAYSLYSSPLLKRMESLSILVVIISINFGLLSSFQEFSLPLKLSFLIIVFISNFYFLAFWIVSYFGVARKLLK